MEALQFETAILADIYSEVERRFAPLDDLAHGWEHVDRVYTLALQLAEQEGANRFIVGAAALMHDLGRTVGHHTTVHHADLSVTMARELLAMWICCSMWRSKSRANVCALSVNFPRWPWLRGLNVSLKILKML